MPQNLVRGLSGAGGNPGTAILAGWGAATIFPPLNLSGGEALIFQESEEDRKIYLFNEGPGEIRISLGENYNENSPLILLPGALLEEESGEKIWGRGEAILKRMIRIRRSPEAPQPQPAPSLLTILSEGEFAGKIFVPSGAINLIVTAGAEFRGYNTEWMAYQLHRSEALENLYNPKSNGIFISEIFLEPPDFSSELQISEADYQAGNFYCIQAWLDFLQVDETAFLSFDESTNTLTLS